MLSKPLKYNPMLYNNKLSLVHLNMFPDHNSLVHLNMFLVPQWLPLQLSTTTEEITQAEDKSSTTHQAELSKPAESNNKLDTL